jgi:hypothetical protein
MSSASMDLSMGMSLAGALESSYGSGVATWEGVSSRVMDDDEAAAVGSMRRLASDIVAGLPATWSASDLFGRSQIFFEPPSPIQGLHREE